MREILFRGKRVDGNGWVEGSLLQSEISTTGYCECTIVGSFAFCNDIDRNDVHPETVGQFTGLLDKNGKRIFEDDIVSAWSEGYNHKGRVRWRLEAQPSIIIYPAFANQGFWKLHGNRDGDSFIGNKVDDGVEIIGNIHDNPEIL